MDENRLKSIVESAIKPVLDQLNDPETGLKRLNEKMDSNTAAIVELESTIKGYADSYKANDANIRKVAKRLETLEEDANIDVSPELQLVAQSDL